MDDDVRKIKEARLWLTQVIMPVCLIVGIILTKDDDTRRRLANKFTWL